MIKFWQISICIILVCGCGTQDYETVQDSDELQSVSEINVPSDSQDLSKQDIENLMEQKFQAERDQIQQDINLAAKRIVDQNRMLSVIQEKSALAYYRNQLVFLGSIVGGGVGIIMGSIYRLLPKKNVRPFKSTGLSMLATGIVSTACGAALSLLAINLMEPFIPPELQSEGGAEGSYRYVAPADSPASDVSSLNGFWPLMNLNLPILMFDQNEIQSAESYK